jgi:hypothetical protein
MAGAIGMDRLVGLPAAGKGDAGGVDHRIAALDRRGDRGGHAQVGLQQVDLTDIAERLDGVGQPDAAARDADHVALARQGLNNGAADEAAAAEYGDLPEGHGLPIAQRRRRASSVDIARHPPYLTAL